MEFITIDTLKLDQQHPYSQEIITIPKNSIINSSFNKQPMSWEKIHWFLLHPSDSSTKEMCRHKTLYGLPKHCHNKIHKAPCAICYTKKNDNYQQGHNSLHKQHSTRRKFSHGFFLLQLQLHPWFYLHSQSSLCKDYNAMSITYWIQNSTYPNHALKPDNTDELTTPMNFFNSWRR